MIHTPGPWDMIHRTVSEKPLRIREHYAIVPTAGPSLAILPDGREARSDIQKANARLIAAAPELLAALKAMIQGYQELAECNRLEYEHAWAVIAKAEGR
jgi:hypothetical protein